MKKNVFILLAPVLFLLVMGLVMLHPTEGAWLRDHDLAARAGHYFWRQVTLTVVGLAMMAWAASTDSRIWQKLALPLVLVTLFLLALVLIPPIGTRLFGVYGMFDIGPVQVRPALLARIAILFYLAFWLSRPRPSVQDPRLQETPAFQNRLNCPVGGVLLPMLPVIMVVALVWAEPDPASNSLIAIVVPVLLLLGGVGWRIVGALGVATLGAFLLRAWLNPIAWARLCAVFHSEPLHEGISRSPSIGQMVLSKGGWTGVGLGNDHFRHSLPASASSDHIGAFIGEAFGLAGLLCVLLAFTVFVVAGFWVSARTSDRFGFLLGAGIVSLIGFQALLHMVSVTCLLPIRPVSLPFVSYGGGELCILLTGVGVLLSIARDAQASHPIQD